MPVRAALHIAEGRITCALPRTQPGRPCPIGVGPIEAAAQAISGADLDPDVATDPGARVRAFDLDEIRSINGAPVDPVVGDAGAVALRQRETRRSDDDKSAKRETQTAVECHALRDSVLLVISPRQLG